MASGQDNDASDETQLFDARCRSRSTSVGVQVLDLSAAGCMVATQGWRFMSDEKVLISLPGLSYLRASVLWTDENTAGLQFDQPLYEPVLAHLLEARAA